MMKSIPLCCGILALTAVVSAQTPQASTTSSGTITTRQSDQTTVITGCVSADTASDTSAASGTGRRFILSNAQLLTDAQSGQGRQASATSFLLTNSDLSLGEHVGHKVQLTGYVDSTSSSGASSQSMPVFHATSVRMVSSTCQ